MSPESLPTGLVFALRGLLVSLRARVSDLATSTPATSTIQPLPPARRLWGFDVDGQPLHKANAFVRQHLPTRAQ